MSDMTNPPLLIVGHGTRKLEGVGQFTALAARVRSRGSDAVPAVEGGMIELARPTVGEAMSRLLAGTDSGSGRSVVAVPLMLAAAGHSKGDIPASLARERVRHPGVRFAYGRPLGPHPALNDVLETRIDEVLAGADRAGTHVVLVGRGGTDPDANAEVAKVARLLLEGRGYAGVEPSFISLAEPSLPAALDKVRRLGAGRVVVAPYFLFAGVISDQIAAGSKAFADAHPGVDVRVAELIGDCDELADLVLERYREALAGDIRMNCDTCAYRVALPGSAGKVGFPQTPHAHPDEDHSHDHRRSDAGSVALVGAGPGPEGLITVRGAELLAEADVVVTDRLVPPGLLAGLEDRVTLVDVGKVPRGPSARQQDINGTLVDHARAGRRVVRLKGGDPYVFGRGFEEVLALREAGIEPEVVPGVSSALAAPSLAGIPVTHRGMAHEFTVVSGHIPPGHPDSLVDWTALGRLRGTLVMLMAVENAGKIAVELLEHGRPADSPVMIVERAGARDQRRVTTRLDELGEVIEASGIQPPATIVIGPVAGLARDAGGH
ncbi:MAG: sirohydrochlorin cobaltochelatase [Actinomycetota bacterium]|nr:sirohydrochlorin cobaltochelatase [Actinomycetota bacterium]